MNRLVLFVCTGNLCRSPLAEALASRMYPQADLEFRSAGLDAPPGEPASTGARLAASELGLDLSRHLSRPLTAQLLASSWWAIGMTDDHVRRMRGLRAPGAGGRIGLLGAPGAERGDGGPARVQVADPYGMPPQAYTQAAGLICDLLQGWAGIFRPESEPGRGQR